MARRRFVWDPEVRELVEVDTSYRQPVAAGPYVQGNFTPQMGIEDRGAWRRHERANNLVPTHEALAIAKQSSARREKIARDRRLAAVRDSYEHVRNQERARDRFG